MCFPFFLFLMEGEIYTLNNKHTYLLAEKAYNSYTDQNKSNILYILYHI